MTRPNGFPELLPSEYAVVCAEVDTGIVLSIAGVRAIGTVDTYRVFASAAQAAACAKALVAANANWECAVLDHEGRVVERFEGVWL